MKHFTQTAQALPRSDALRQDAGALVAGAADRAPGLYNLRDLLTAAREETLQQAFALLAAGLTAEQREPTGRFAVGTFR